MASCLHLDDNFIFLFSFCCFELLLIYCFRKKKINYNNQNKMGHV